MKDITMFRILAVSALTLAAAPAFAQDGDTYRADELRIVNALGNVEVIEGEGEEIEVSIQRGDDRDAPAIRVEARDGVLTLQGEGGDITDGYSCNDYRGEPGYRKSGLFNRGQSRPLSDANDIRITAPGDIAMTIQDSILASEIAHVGAFTLNTRSCGQADIGRIDGDLWMDLRGAYDLEVESAQSAYLDIRGAGDIDIGEVNGEVAIDLKGAADISIADGRADPLIIDLAGAGDISIGATAINPEVTLKGVGDISIDSYEGRFEKEIFGLGDISAECTANCN